MSDFAFDLIIVTIISAIAVITMNYLEAPPWATTGMCFIMGLGITILRRKK